MSATSQVAESARATDLSRTPFQFRLWHLLAVTAILSVLLAIVVPAMRAIRRLQQHEASVMNLREIAIGLHNYHDVWQSLPPAYACDAAGQPAHSWRVLLTPFLTQLGIDSVDYNFAEPWNSPNNSQYGRNVFRNRLNSTNAADRTSYVAVVGPGTAWSGEESLSFSDITDGMSRTVMIVEISHSDIHWREPRDLPIEELDAWLDPQHRPRLGGAIEGGLVLFADGSVAFLPRELAKKRLRALLTPTGNEPVSQPDEAL